MFYAKTFAKMLQNILAGWIEHGLQIDRGYISNKRFAKMF